MLIMSAQFSVHLSMAIDNIYSPQRVHLVRAWLSIDYPGEPQITTTALDYSPLYDRAGVL